MVQARYLHEVRLYLQHTIASALKLAFCSTLRTSCLPSGSAKGAEAVAFFQTVVKLFKALPTYTWLQAAGISPSSSKTYTRAELAAALKAKYGYTPALDCESGAVYQVSYYYNLKGSVIDGQWIPIGEL